MTTEGSEMDEERSQDTPKVEETFADESATPAAGTGEPGGASEEALDEEGSEEGDEE